MRDHSLVVITLLLLYFAVNVLLAVRGRVFTMAPVAQACARNLKRAFGVGFIHHAGIRHDRDSARLDDEAASTACDCPVQIVSSADNWLTASLRSLWRASPLRVSCFVVGTGNRARKSSPGAR